MQQKSPHCHPSSFLIGWSNTWHWKRQWAGHWDNRNRIVLMKDMKSKDFPRFQNFAPLEGSRVNFWQNFRRVNQLRNHQTAVYLDTWLEFWLFFIPSFENWRFWTYFHKTAWNPQLDHLIWKAAIANDRRHSHPWHKWHDDEIPLNFHFRIERYIPYHLACISFSHLKDIK